MARKPLTGTRWRCTDEDWAPIDMLGTIIDGFIDPDWNGENDVEIKHDDGSTAVMKYRRFVCRYNQLTEEDTLD